MEACAFCDIVAGRRSAHVVHETGAVIAFLDQFRQPADAAHVLVIPRGHVENIYAVDDALGAELFAAHAFVARAVKRAFAPDGISTWSSNERGANQEVPHFHLHVYPRRVGVPFPATIHRPEVPVADDALLASAERIRRAVGEIADPPRGAISGAVTQQRSAETLLDLLADASRDLRKEIEALDQEELAWRPDPRANNIGVTVWHVARWFDLLAHRILLSAAEEIWYRDGWAERTGYDPRGIGLRGWGAVTGYTVDEVAKIPPLPADQLVAYLDASVVALTTAVREISAEALMSPPPGYSGSRSAYDWVRSVLEGAFGHLGEIRSLRTLRRWSAGA